MVNFFDVLGIGAFAPQAALLKFTKQTDDRVLPGTMNIANTATVMLRAGLKNTNKVKTEETAKGQLEGQ